MARTAQIPRPVEATLQVVLATGEVVPDPTDADLAQFGLTDARDAYDRATSNLGAEDASTLRPILGLFDYVLQQGEPPTAKHVAEVAALAEEARRGFDPFPGLSTEATGPRGAVTVNEEFGFEPEEQERLFGAVPPRVKLAVLGHYLRMAQAADSPPLTVLRAQHDALDRAVRPWEYEKAKAS